MSDEPRSPLASGRMKKAVQAFCELLENHPQRSRRELLQTIQLQFDLSPLECEFLNNHLADDCKR